MGPTRLLASVSFEEASVIASHWRQAKIEGGLHLTNGTYWLAFRYQTGAWAAMVVPGKHIHVELPSAVGLGLPTSLTSEAAQWKSYGQSGVPVVAHWEADWCDLGGTTPPSVVKHDGDAGDGRLLEPHGRYLTDGHTVYRNVSISDNTFIGPNNVRMMQGDVWKASFIHVGAVDGLTLRGNTMTRRIAGTEADVDMFVYSSKGVAIGDNVCIDKSGSSAECVLSDITHHLPGAAGSRHMVI